MDNDTTKKRKQTSSSTTKFIKKNIECPTCSATVKNMQDHICPCKTGLINIGNSCYISTIFQAISELQIYSNLSQESSLFTLLQQLSTHSEAPYCPDLALFEIKDLWTHEGEQEDAYEFLMTILPLFESNKFMYEYLNQKYCENCNNYYEAVVREDYCVNLSIDKKLKDLLETIVDPIDEICGNCNKGFLMNLRSFLKEPEILMVRIMRFQINAKTGKPSKL